MTEAALAHRIGDTTEASYVRGDMFERRRALMEQWAQHVGMGSPPQTAHQQAPGDLIPSRAPRADPDRAGQPSDGALPRDHAGARQPGQP